MAIADETGDKLLERKILGESPLVNGNIILEQIGKSLYFRISNDSGKNTIRCMDISSIIDANEFIDIAKRIEKSGKEILVNRMGVYVWDFEHKLHGAVRLSREWKFTHDKENIHYYRHDININGYEFIYYPETISSIGAANIYDVPFNKGGSVYVRISYENFVDSQTDDELLETSKIQIENLRKL